MQIAKNKVAAIEYTLTDDQGTVLDTSEGREPLAYIQGIGNLVPGLEAALEGKAAGDELAVSIAPDDGYGQRDDRLEQVVKREVFGDVSDLNEGMQFEAESEVGTRVYTITKIEEDDITVDGNHPLAGLNLHFDVKIVEVRDATAEELEHGHVHGPGGHHH